MPHHTVYVAGTEYPWSYLKYKRSFSILAQKFTVEIPNLESFTPGDTIEIKRDGTTVAKGKLAMGSWKTDQGVKTVLTSFDYRRKFQLLKGVLTAPDTEAYTHLENQLTNTDLTKGTFNTYGNITVDYGATEPARFDRRRIAEEIMFITGWEFYTSPAGVCDFKSQCGTDRSSTIRFSREEGTLLGWAEDYVQNGLLKVEKVTVIGKGAGSYQAYGSAQTGGYSAGDPEKTVNRKTLVNNTLCGTAATALLADMQNTIKYGVPRVVNVNEGLAFDVFDTINIRDERLGIDENLRVAGITVEARADEGEVTLVEVCNIAHLQTSGEILIGDVRGRVEDDFARTQQLMSVAQQTAAEAAATGLGNVAGGTGLNNVSNDTGLNNVSGATGLGNVDGATGLGNVAGPTGLGNVAAAAGLANESVGGHIHSLYNRSGYLVTGWVTRYCAATSGGPVTQAFSAPTGSTLDYYVYGTAVATGGGHNHAHGADSHGHTHSTDSHGHTHGADNHGHTHGTDSHGHSHGADSHGHTHGTDNHGHSHGTDSHGTVLDKPVHIH